MGILFTITMGILFTTTMGIQFTISKKASADEMLFIGDSPEDQLAAGSLGIHFIKRQSDRPLDDSRNNTFSDFLKIKDYSSEHYEL